MAPRTRSAADTRAAILDAAAEEFARNGHAGARVREIVAKAGANEERLYYYFGSKEQLYLAALVAERERWLELYQPVVEEAAQLDPVAGMRRLLTGLFDTLAARPLFVRMTMYQLLADTNQVPVPISTDELVAVFRDLYQRGRKSGAFRDDEDDFEIVYAMLFGSVVHLVVGRAAIEGYLELAHSKFTNLADASERVGELLVNSLLRSTPT